MNYCLTVNDDTIYSSFRDANIKYKVMCVDNKYIENLISLMNTLGDLDLNDMEIWDTVLKQQNITPQKKEIICIQTPDDMLHKYFYSVYKDVINITSDIDRFILDRLNGKNHVTTRHTLYTDRMRDNILEDLLGIKVDNIYCITLYNRKDRHKSIMKQFAELNLAFDMIKVEKNEKDPVKGCLDSHMICVKDAKKRGFENVLIFEDDVMINFGVLQQFYDNKTRLNIPKDFDMFYLGYNVNNGYKYDKNIMKIISAQCAHAYILNNQVFDYILENVEKDWTQFPEWNVRNEYEKQQNFNCRAIDLFYAKIVNHMRNKSYGIYPLLCYQQETFSDIENRTVSYNKTLLTKSVFHYNCYKHPFSTYVVNLERRKDRFEEFAKNYPYEFQSAIQFKAVDGEKFDFKPVLSLFNYGNKERGNIKNPYHLHEYRTGVLGCALSHFKLWSLLANNKNIKDDTFILILEDDIELCDNFIQKTNDLLDYLVTDDKWDITFMGFTDYADTNDTKINDKLIRFSGDKRLRGGGTFGYFIRKRGARKLIDLALKHKIRQAIDWFMIEQFDTVVCYKATPELIFSKVDDGKGDSDVQKSGPIQIVKDFANKQKKMARKLKAERLKKTLPPTIPEVDESDLEVIPEYKEPVKPKEEAKEEPVKPKEEPVKAKEEAKENVEAKHFREIIHDNNNYFLNDDKEVFEVRRDVFNYVGQMEDGKIVESYKARNAYGHSLKRQNREYLLVYVDKEIPYYFRKIIEILTKKYMIIVVSEDTYNIRVNNVYYVCNNKSGIIGTIIHRFNVKRVLITSFNYFLYGPTVEGQKIWYFYTGNKLLCKYNEKLLRDSGISLVSNYAHRVDNYIFFSGQQEVEFKAFNSLDKINAVRSCYALEKIPNLTIKDSENIIVSYDKHYTNVINFFAYFSKIKPGYTLVLFDDDTREIKANGNIIIIPRNYHNLKTYLARSKLFISFENDDATYYNILTAMVHHNICVVSKIFSELSGKTLMFDVINGDFIKSVAGVLDDEEKLNSLDNICKVVLAEEIKHNKWNDV